MESSSWPKLGHGPLERGRGQGHLSSGNGFLSEGEGASCEGTEISRQREKNIKALGHDRKQRDMFSHEGKREKGQEPM